MVPLVVAGVAKSLSKVDWRSSGAITKGDEAKVDAAAAAVRAGGASAPFTADRGETRGALEWIQIWATSPTLGFAKADRRAYAAKVYMELAGRPPSDTPGVVAAQNGPTANTNSGLLDSLSSFVTRVTQGPSQNIGTAAGAAAGEKVKSTIVLVGGLLAVALVVAVVLIKRR